jgi:hypothetical protein
VSYRNGYGSQALCNPEQDAISEESLLSALLNRDLITEGLDPVLTPTGIEEAEWFSRARNELAAPSPPPVS